MFKYETNLLINRLLEKCFTFLFTLRIVPTQRMTANIVDESFRAFHPVRMRVSFRYRKFVESKVKCVVGLYYNLILTNMKCVFYRIKISYSI